MTLTELSAADLIARMRTELPEATTAVVRAYRDALLAMEKAGGLGEAHRIASELLADRRQLVHSAQHDERLTAQALSRCGNYLATGATCSDDYDAGGDLVVWDLRTGAVVHVVTGIVGGVGWSWTPGQMCWAADSEAIFLGFNTNQIGRLDVFDEDEGDDMPSASLTDGWDSPPSWALAPDGSLAVLVTRADHEDQAIAIVTLGDGDVEDDDCEWLDNTIPEGMVSAAEDDDGDDDDEARVVSSIYSGARIYCPDAERVLVHNGDVLFCFDRSSRRLRWRSQVAKPVALSAGGEYFAHHPAGIVFYSGRDGLPTPWLPMHVGASALVFEPAAGGERPPRLAALIEADNDYGAELGVHIYDGGEFVCGPDLSPASASEDCDFPALAWSPDGRRFACLTSEDSLEVWRIEGRGPGATAHKEHVLGEIAGVGVAWPAEDRVVVAGGEALIFVDPLAGEILVRRTLVAAEADYDPRVDELPRRERFAQSGSWVTLQDGAVVADEAVAGALDQQLGWVVDRRVAWPLRWAPPVVTSPPVRVAEPVVDFPPARIGDEVDVLRALVASTSELGRGWRSHRSELLRLAAREFSRRGLLADVAGCLDEIPEFSQSIAARAECVAILAAAGKRSEALALRDEEGHLRSGGEGLEIDDDNTYEQALYGSALGAMCHALGDAAGAARWFTRAEAAVDNDESNAGDHRHMLALDYLLVGLDEEALALLRRPLPSSPSTSSALPLVLYMARHGKWSHFDAFVRDGWIREYAGDAWDVMPIVARYADAARIAEYAALFGEEHDIEEYGDADELAARRAPPPTPSDEDIAELRAAYAAIMRLPTRRRADAADDGVEVAVRVGHWSAAIALLEFLDGSDMNGRPQEAAKMAWRALGGLDVPVW